MSSGIRKITAPKRSSNAEIVFKHVAFAVRRIFQSSEVSDSLRAFTEKRKFSGTCDFQLSIISVAAIDRTCYSTLLLGSAPRNTEHVFRRKLFRIKTSLPFLVTVTAVPT